MRSLIKIALILVPIFIIGFSINTIAQTEPSYEPMNPDPNYIAENPHFITNPDAPLILRNCSKYPGFFNKLVSCITHMTTRETVINNLFFLNKQFAGVTNVVLIVYIMLFGLKLTLNAVENVRSEMIIVIITCFFITYVNNVTRMDGFIKFFVGFQNEFVQAATVTINEEIAIGTIYSGGGVIHNQSGSGVQRTAGSQPVGGNIKYLCYAPLNSAGAISGFPYNIWSKMDCLIAYILGMHPVSERKTQYSSPDGEGHPANLLSDYDTNYDAKYSYGLFFKGDVSLPWRDMATEPYKFQQNCTPQTIILGTCTANDLLRPRTIVNSQYEVFMMSSLAVIAYGMFFSQPADGVVIGLMVVSIILLIIAAFGQAALVYITSLFAIMVLGLFAPIILPTVLFKQTRQIFETWVQLLFSYSIQPGIILCYLAFMLTVLEYVITYPLVINGTEYQMVELLLGKPYTEGSKTPEPTISINSKTQTGNNRAYGTGLIQAGYSQRSGSTNQGLSYSWVDRGSDVYNVAAIQTSTENKKALLQAGRLRNTGTNLTTLSLPTFNFYTGDIFGKSSLFKAVQKQTYTGDPVLSNLELAQKRAQENKYSIGGLAAPCVVPLDCPVEKQVEYTKEAVKGQFQAKTAFMQALMILLTTLAITYSFMGNVMKFAGTLVGASAPTVAGTTNLYSIASRKLSAMVKS